MNNTAKADELMERAVEVEEAVSRKDSEQAANVVILQVMRHGCACSAHSASFVFEASQLAITPS